MTNKPSREEILKWTKLFKANPALRVRDFDSQTQKDFTCFHNMYGDFCLDGKPEFLEMRNSILEELGYTN